MGSPSSISIYLICLTSSMNLLLRASRLRKGTVSMVASNLDCSSRSCGDRECVWQHSNWAGWNHWDMAFLVKKHIPVENHLIPEWMDIVMNGSSKNSGMAHTTKKYSSWWCCACYWTSGRTIFTRQGFSIGIKDAEEQYHTMKQTLEKAGKHRTHAWINPESASTRSKERRVRVNCCHSLCRTK